MKNPKKFGFPKKVSRRFVELFEGQGKKKIDAAQKLKVDFETKTGAKLKTKLAKKEFRDKLRGLKVKVKVRNRGKKGKMIKVVDREKG